MYLSPPLLLSPAGLRAVLDGERESHPILSMNRHQRGPQSSRERAGLGNDSPSVNGPHWALFSSFMEREGCFREPRFSFSFKNRGVRIALSSWCERPRTVVVRERTGGSRGVSLLSDTNAVLSRVSSAFCLAY